MKNKEFKSILNEWNSYIINESTAARVKRMIDNLEQHNYKIVIYEPNEDQIKIMYMHRRGNINSPVSIRNDRLYGSISCRSSKALRMGKNTAKFKGIGQGEVNSTWYVSLTAETKDGMGPLLYEVLIEYIGLRKNAALKPDAGSVSSEARAVWEKFDNRADIRKIQLDVDSDSVRNNRRYGDVIDQITPNNVNDDTRQNSAIYDKGPENWHTSALSRAYRKDNTDLIDDLKSRGLIEMPKLPRVFKSKLGGAWG